ncbi:ArnT family glycosyltransferase [Acidipila rosea]|uniref:Dolichyl-phosphate-mannose-protein mannosyltransferase n=1 Tax=Acidipila rosea TaxID=768535 RepID=A0A4V2PUW6_9BACT|nr:glycosyltransferase family 39 protein [Acidipila rosea]TCK72001.1 dolichyl-phosphate-mannose-protein mannosyltransferase [Acidipila rosea]
MHLSKKLSFLDLLYLVCCIAASLLLWRSYLAFNLPVAANVDERTGLEILTRFHTSGLNPHFFLYPTFYYYFTYFATRPWSFSDVLLHGRILNMAFVGVTGWIAYMFCVRFFRSRLAGLIAAFAIVTSPLISFSGSYLCTDVFLAASTLASIYFLTGFFTDGNKRSWTTGMVLLGLAVGCKYTAFLLFVAYLAQESALRFREQKHQQETEGGPFVSRRLLVALLCTAGVVLALAATAFPTHLVLSFIAQTRTNPNGRPAAEYLPFFHSLRIKLGAAGLLFLALAALSLWVDQVYRALAPTRLYKAFAIILVMALVTTPYSVITPKRFILDLGSLAKLNLVVVVGAQQWHNYWMWYLQSEALILGAFALAGFLLLLRQWPKYGLGLIYVVLYFLVIGTSHKGYARYLTAILPLLYCYASYALLRLVSLPVRGRKLSPILEYAVVAAIAAVTLYNTAAHIQEVRRLSATHDEFWQSYTTARRLRPAAVLTLGDAPDVELANAGMTVVELPQSASLNPVMLSSLHCDQLLIVEGHFADPNTLSSTTLAPVLRAQGVYGQEVFRQQKQNCR